MNIIINNSSGESIYLQIQNQIKDSIVKEIIKTDEMLPSIRALARELRISVITTKRAYDELEREGFVYTIPGKGSFVAPKDKELIKEEVMRTVEHNLIKAIDESKKINLTLEDLKNALEVLYDAD